METSTVTNLIMPLAIGVIMLGLGLSLTVDDFRRVVVYPKAVAIGLGCQMLILPCAAFGLATVFHLPPELAVGLMLLAASPGGPSANLFSHLAHGDVALNITITAVNSVFSLLTMPFIVNLALSHFMGQGKVLPLQFDKVSQVFAVVLTPVAIGMLIRARSLALAQRMERPVRIVSAGFLLLVIVVAVLKERARLSGYIVAVGVPALVVQPHQPLRGLFHPAPPAPAEAPGDRHRHGDRHPQRHARDHHRVEPDAARQRRDGDARRGLQPRHVLHRGGVWLVGVAGTSPGVNAAALAHPAFSSVTPFAARLAGMERWPSIEELDTLFRDRLAITPGIELEAQLEQPRRRGPRCRDDVYEVRIQAHRRLPTRPESWHDLANLLVWCAFPRAKRALVARQYEIVRRRVPADARGLPSARTREQDALAMLDEGGVLLLRPAGLEIDLGAPEAVHAALAERRIALRLFGHALLEAVATGGLRERDLRGAAVVLTVRDPLAAAMDEADAALARHLEDPRALQAPDPARSLWLTAALAAADQPSC